MEQNQPMEGRMGIRPEIEKIIAMEYQDRRTRNVQRTQDAIDAVYRLHPALQAIDRQMMLENAAIAMQIMQDGQFRPDSPRKNELMQQRSLYLSTHQIPMDFDAVQCTCSICHDTGFVRNGASSGRTDYCSCYNQLVIPLLFKNSNFKNVAKYDFAQFNLSYFSDQPDPKRYQSADSPRKHMMEIRYKAQYFLDHFEENRTRSLFLMGRPGTGKTFLSGCIANELLAKGKSVLYLSSPELFEKLTEFRMLSNSFSPDPERFENATRIYQCILECDLLILDDLGTETIHENRQPELLHIINHRTDSNKKMIISSNLDAPSLSALYDERVLSRIYGSCDAVKIFGEDLRHVIPRES